MSNLELQTSNDASFWTKRRVTVTGGAGFLGSFVVEKLRERGCRDLFVPRSSQYDLVEMEAIKRLYREARPDIVIHLAARVGGIGANRANPGQFFYDNAMMGIQLMEQGRLFGLQKFVALGTVWAYPKSAPGWQRRCSWYNLRRTGNNTDSILFISCRSTSTDRATISTWKHLTLSRR